jgi:hypothetical protein
LRSGISSRNLRLPSGKHLLILLTFQRHAGETPTDSVNATAATSQLHISLKSITSFENFLAIHAILLQPNKEVPPFGFPRSPYLAILTLHLAVLTFPTYLRDPESNLTQILSIYVKSYPFTSNLTHLRQIEPGPSHLCPLVNHVLK